MTNDPTTKPGDLIDVVVCDDEIRPLTGQRHLVEDVHVRDGEIVSVTLLGSDVALVPAFGDTWTIVDRAAAPVRYEYRDGEAVEVPA